MSWLDRLFPNDRELAATKYKGRESATALAERKRRTKALFVRSYGVREAARAGQAWEDQDRRRERERGRHRYR